MQVYQLSIGAACGLSWPSDRIIIQILDDSTDPTIKVNIKTQHGLVTGVSSIRVNDVTIPGTYKAWIGHTQMK